MSETTGNTMREWERIMADFDEEVSHNEFVYPSDVIKVLKKGNHEDPYNARHIAIVELICKIRKLDELEFNEIHPLIDEILKVDDYTLRTQYERLNELYEETKIRRQEGIYPPYNLPDYFAFKTQDRKGKMHMLNCDTLSLSLAELTNAIVSELGDEVPLKILYKRDDGDVKPDSGDKVVIASDSDLIDAVNYAISAKWDVLKLHLEYSARSRVACAVQRVGGGFALVLGILVLQRKLRGI